MAGSGGSQQAMFAAIKASIDNGTGSILNVAPGSSIAGRPFSEGHFIAATGYNADGTINLSDTARGTRYHRVRRRRFPGNPGAGGSSRARVADLRASAHSATGRAPARTGPAGPAPSVTGRRRDARREAPTCGQLDDSRQDDDAGQPRSDADDRVQDLQSQPEHTEEEARGRPGDAAGLGPVASAAQQAEIAKDELKELEGELQDELTKASRGTRNAAKRGEGPHRTAPTRTGGDEASKAPPGSGDRPRTRR